MLRPFLLPVPLSFEERGEWEMLFFSKRLYKQKINRTGHESHPV
jgi:hypothetical protein